MRIGLRNVGLIDECEIIIEGITVITGGNATGKSTVGKALYGVYSALYNYDKADKERVLIDLLNENLNIEFYGEIQNKRLNKVDSSIEIINGEDRVRVDIKDNKVCDIEGGLSLDKGIIYIDDPLVVDSLNFEYASFHGYIIGHRDDLRKQLVREKIVGDEDGDGKERIINFFNSLNIGDLVYDGSYKYQEDSLTNLRNVAMGLKTFIIFKTLLQNGSLNYEGIMILDEPEIHIHPNGQIKLAELIVLIQKEFNIKVLINTHSPYFLNAIETYSRHYGISNQCKYYLMELRDSSGYAREVSDNTEDIYKLLAEPFDTLELV